MKNSILTFLLALMMFLAAPLWSVTLFSNGVPHASIVIDANATQPVRFAARELALWLGRATKSQWHVGTEPVDGLIPIYVGASPFASQHGFSPEKLKSDGFLWKITDDFILIAGRDYPGGILEGLITPWGWDSCYCFDLEVNALGEMGTYNGVARFLEKFLGVRWYMTGELGTIVPKCTKLELEAMEVVDAPDFECRYARFCDFSESLRDVLWYRRVGYGAKEPIAINHNYNWMRRYKDSRPDFFALIDGKRDFDKLSVRYGGGNYCLSNPDLVKAWVDAVIQFFKSHPEQNLCPMCPMDGLEKICSCPKCQAQLAPELGEWGSFSNYIWKFTDTVAREIDKRLPGKKIGCFAYEKYKEPPSCLDKLSPNIVVMICYKRLEMTDAAHKKMIRSIIEKWSRKCDNLYFWTYPLTDYWDAWQGIPVCYPHLIAQDIRMNRDLGCKGEFLEATFLQRYRTGYDYNRIRYPGLSHINAYVTAKMLWDADTDVDALLEEYYAAFYGKAAGSMKLFWERVENVLMAHRYWQSVTPPEKFFTQEDISELYRLLSEAEKQANGTPAYHRIQMIRREMEPAMANLRKKLKGA